MSDNCLIGLHKRLVGVIRMPMCLIGRSKFRTTSMIAEPGPIEAYEYIFCCHGMMLD